MVTSKALKKKKVPKTVDVFYTKNHIKSIQIRNQEYTFHHGKLEVPLDIGALIRTHAHCASGVIIPSEDAILVNDQLEAKANHKDLMDLLDASEGTHIFRYNLGPHMSVPIKGKEVIFDNHYAVVNDEQAELLRNHTFINLGKISEVQIEIEM